MLAGGTALGQVLTVAAAPLLARLYSPDDFGVLAVYTSIVSVLSVLSSLNYHLAIPLPEKDDVAAQILILSLLLLGATAVLSSILVLFWGSSVAALANTPSLERYVWLIPVGVVGAGGYEAVLQWAVRRKAFGVIARTSVVRGVAQVAVQCGVGVFGATSVGLLAGQVVGQSAGVGGLSAVAWRESREALLSVSRQGVAAAAVRYRDFSLYSTPGTLLSAMGYGAPALVLSFYFGSAAAGLFALAFRTIAMPVTLVSKSAAQVLLSTAAEAHRAGRLGEEVESVFEKLLRAALPLTSIGFIVMPDLFALVFGQRWLQAGEFVQWMCPWLLIMFVAFALGPVVVVLERQGVGTSFQVTLFLGRLAALVVGGARGSLREAVGLFALVSAALWLAYLCWVLSAAGLKSDRSLKQLLTVAIASAPLVAPALAGKILFDDYRAVCAMAAVSSVLVALRLVGISPAKYWRK